MNSHVLSVLVKTHAGVLSKISGLFSRRCFNIDSLTVGETERSEVSRMTIVARGDEIAIEQVKNQLSKLIDVIMVEEIDSSSVRRELALLKVKATLEHRVHIMEMANVFRARIVDISSDSMTMEVTGVPEKIRGLIDMVRPFGIIEIVRTGLIALERGPEALSAE